MRYLKSLVLFTVLAASLPMSAGQARQEQPTQPAPLQTILPTEQSDGSVQIISPKTGQALQGSVPVVVDTTTTNFQSVELTFGYMDDPTQTWFWIHQGIQAVTGTMLVLWDTSKLTDGNYQLRLQVNFTDGSQQTAVVRDLRVRNYTPIETSTPAPPTAVQTITIKTTTATPALSAPIQATTALSTRTPAAPFKNPVSVSRQNILSSAGLGILTVFGLFALGLVYQAARSLRRRR